MAMLHSFLGDQVRFHLQGSRLWTPCLILKVCRSVRAWLSLSSLVHNESPIPKPSLERTCIAIVAAPHISCPYIREQAPLKLSHARLQLLQFLPRSEKAAEPIDS